MDTITVICRGRTWSESDVRLLRDAVYRNNQGDRSWSGCKYLWMHPDEVKWLLEQRENAHVK